MKPTAGHCESCAMFRLTQRILDPATGQQVPLGTCSNSGATHFADEGCAQHAPRPERPAAP